MAHAVRAYCASEAPDQGGMRPISVLYQRKTGNISVGDSKSPIRASELDQDAKAFVTADVLLL